MSDNIKVAIKVRPLITREKRDQLPVQWAIENNKIAQFDPETKRRGETEYTFDYIFDQKSTNEDVFKATVEPVVGAAMRGFNGTIFAYGQTSSGKTYTMMGTKQEPGVIPLAVEAIFDYIMKDETREFVLSVSYIELYNEKVNDLLDTKNQDLKLREDNGEVKMDCKEEVAHSVKDILIAMKRGEKNRRIGETNMNEKSSRSHTIFRITIGSVLRSDPDGDAIVAQLNLIDLAGSERAKETGATGDRFKEGKHINLSLSTLGLVINQLSESQIKGKGHKGAGHINYRDSKLTRILQSSLGGNSLTTIICAVTPAAGDETSCTLAFAQRAKGIKNKPKVNETGSDEALVKKFRKQIHKLEENLKNMSKALKEKDEKLQDVEILKGRIELLKTKVLCGDGSRSDGRKHRSQSTRRRTWGGSVTSPLDSPVTCQLPTIPESELPAEDPEEKKRYIKRRQSVFRNVKMVEHDESFSTNWEDFELQLIKDEEEKMARWSSESTDFPQDPRDVDCRRVRFVEERDIDYTDNCDNTECVTPEKTKSDDSSSPGTPKTYLRQQITNLHLEYNQLRSYTTLEKLVRQETIAQEPTVEFLQKSLLDSEQICIDINKKYSELQSEHSILKSQHQESLAECRALRETIETLKSSNEQMPTLESERNFYKAKFTETMNKLKILEDETSSHSYAMELLINKHKLREKELENSLNSAWEELKSTRDEHDKQFDNKNDNNDSLRILVSELTNKLTSAEQQIEEITNENRELNAKQNLLTTKADEDVKNHEKIIDELNNKIKELKVALDSKNLDIEDLQKSISAGKIEEELQKHLENDEISMYSEKIKDLEKKMDEKLMEISALTGAHEKTLLEKSEELSRVTESLTNAIKQLESDNESLKRQLLQKTQEASPPPAAVALENTLTSPTINPGDSPLETSKLQSQAEETRLKPQSNVRTAEKTILEESMISNMSFFNSFSLEKSLAPTDSVFTNETMSSTVNTTISASLLDPDQSLLPESQLQSLTSKSPDQLLSVIMALDKENRKLMKEFQQKTLETDEIKNYIPTFKADVENLRETVIILTNENAELTMKLEHEREHSEEIKRSFEKQMTNIMEEKRSLETLNKSMNNSGINLMNFSVTLPGDDVQGRVDSLTAENNQLSSDLMEKLEELEGIKKNLELMRKKCENFEKENEDLSNNLMEKIEEYEGIIKGLKEELLLKSDPCKKCGHLSELIQARKTLKMEVKSADKKLENLKEEFVRKSASVERLQEKAKESIDVSGLMDDTIFNGSILEAPDGIDTVSYVEEKVQKLHSELEGLRTNYDSLTILYNQKCQEIESLSDKKIDKIQEELQRHKDDLQKFKKSINNVSNVLEKFKDEQLTVEREMQALREQNQCLMERVKEEERILLESRAAGEALESLQKTVHNLNEELRNSGDENKRLIDEISSLKSQIHDQHISPEVQELEEAKSFLMKEVSQHFEESPRMMDLIQLFSTKILQESTASGEKLESLQKSLDTLTEDLKNSKEENTRLIDEISSLKSQINDQDISPVLQELAEAKSFLMSEISHQLEESPSITDLIKLVSTKILQESTASREKLESLQKSLDTLTEDLKNSREENIRLIDEISSLKSQINDQDISPGLQELEEAKSYLKKEISSLQSSQQFDESPLIIDLIKIFISTIMAKEREIIQKIESSHKNEKLTLEEEKKQLIDAEKRTMLWTKELEADVERLQHDLSTEESKKLALEEEISRLKNLLKELNHEKNLLDEKVRVMETDYVTLQSDLEKYSKGSVSEESKSLSPEEHEKILKTKDIEHSSKIHQLEQGHRVKVEELENSLECLKTKNMELRRCIEGLEASKENCQAIIDLKCIELEKAMNSVDRLENELAKTTAACDNLKGSCDEHLGKVEELTKLLKIKCDKLSEMKNQIQMITPEYERLKDESLENQSRLEKYRTEIEFLRGENMKERAKLEEVQDTLRTQEIKSAALEKNLAESKNLNLMIQEQLQDLGEKIETLRGENESLVRKIRNSTSKLTAERDIEDLKDENAGLKKSLEGASNRILELQSHKTQLLSEITDLKSQFSTLQPQLDILQSKNEKLSKENKELDGEMDLMLQKIRELEDHSVNMERKYWDLTEVIDAQEPSYNVLREKYDKLSEDFECQSMKCEFLSKENAELKAKVNSEVANSSRSNSSSRSASPTPGVATRRKRRSDLFNQNRPQELAQEFVVAEERECNCESFRKTITNLEHELVLKKGKITALELKISGLCVPYKKKCQDYEETLGIAKRTIHELQRKVDRLVEEQGKASNCEKCKFWRDNRRDAESQCIPEVMIGFMAPKSGIIQDQIIYDRKIEKLEKEKTILKSIASSRRSEIHLLEKKVKELELQLQSCQTKLSDTLRVTGDISEEMKENVPSNIMGAICLN